MDVEAGVSRGPGPSRLGPSPRGPSASRGEPHRDRTGSADDRTNSFGGVSAEVSPPSGAAFPSIAAAEGGLRPPVRSQRSIERRDWSERRTREGSMSRLEGVQIRDPQPPRGVTGGRHPARGNPTSVAERNLAYQVIDSNLRFLRAAGWSMSGLFLMYLLLSIVGILMALSDLGSLKTTALLTADSSIMILSFGSVFLRLLRPCGSCPGRMQVSGNLTALLTASMACIYVGIFLDIPVLSQLSMVLNGVILLIGFLVLATWVRNAHSQVSTSVHLGENLQLPQRRRVLGAEPAHGQAVDILCCRWLGTGIPMAWPCAGPIADGHDQHLLSTPATGSRRRSSQDSDPRQMVLTLGLYIRLLSYRMGHHSHLSGMHGRLDPVSGLQPRASPPLPSSGALLNLPPRLSHHQRVPGLGLFDTTPSDTADDTHQYFCPLCMLYYAGVYKTHCCDNYVCQECSVVYVSGKRKKAEEAMLNALSQDWSSYKPLMASNVVECPYCQVSGMMLTRVNPWESVKTYEDDDSKSTWSVDSSGVEKSLQGTPASSQIELKVANYKKKGKAKVHSRHQLSIGDDFDALKAKIDHTGFMPDSAFLPDSPANERIATARAALPGISEADPAPDEPSVSAPRSSISGGVGGESENFASGAIGDVLLPNQTDYLPKGVENSHRSSNSGPSGDSSSRGAVDGAAAPPDQPAAEEVAGHQAILSDQEGGRP